MDRRDAVAVFGGMWPSGAVFDRTARTVKIPCDELPDGESLTPDGGVNGDACVTLQCHAEVCDLCDGRGRHVNPNFRESYFDGAYDVRCYACKGERIMLAESASNAPEVLKALSQWRDDEAAFRRENEAERRMGA